MKIFAIETSHDDTSIALYENRSIIKMITISQTEFHKKFGGTLPEYAARNHAVEIVKILFDFLKEFNLKNIDHIAYTKEPGLIGSLYVGKIFAYALGFSLDKPVIPINHMHGHIFSVAFNHKILYPSLALIVSGGHTQIWYLDSPMPKDIKLIGQTLDDALGEVYDKIARKLNIGFPGGPIIDKLSKQGKVEIDFSIKIDKTYNFSFSGIKTKIINYIHNETQKGLGINVENICKSFQYYAQKPLLVKFERAIKEYNPKSIILGGGVSANSQLREDFSKLHKMCLIPEMQYTTDNASMIAITSDLQMKKKREIKWKK